MESVIRAAGITAKHQVLWGEGGEAQSPRVVGILPSSLEKPENQPTKAKRKKKRQQQIYSPFKVDRRAEDHSSGNHSSPPVRHQGQCAVATLPLQLIPPSDAGNASRRAPPRSLPGWSAHLASTVELLGDVPEVCLAGQGVQLVLYVVHELLQ